MVYIYSDPSRKNSLTSLSSVASFRNQGQCSRSMSTEDLVNAGERFRKQGTRKIPSIATGSRHGSLVSNGNIGSVEDRTFYFPNGEPFRPRMSATLRHRPNKIFPRGQQVESPRSPIDQLTNIDKFSVRPPASSSSPKDTIGRSWSSVSLQSVASAQSVSSAAKGSPRLYSTNDFRSLSKQKLSQSLRNNKNDVETNINIGHFKDSYKQESDISGSLSNGPFCAFQHPMVAHKPYQSNNLIKDSELCITDNTLHPNRSGPKKQGFTGSSDSNISSLSNYNLQRSNSNTPQTSISTSNETEVTNNGNKKFSDFSTEFIDKQVPVDDAKAGAESADNELNRIEEISHQSEGRFSSLKKKTDDSRVTGPAITENKGRPFTEENINSEGGRNLIDKHETEKNEMNNESTEVETIGIESSVYHDVLSESSDLDAYDTPSTSPKVSLSPRYSSEGVEHAKRHKTDLFYDNKNNEEFNKLLNDTQQEVPPRADVSVIGDQIRKERRQSSVLCSFRDIFVDEHDSNKEKSDVRNKDLNGFARELKAINQVNESPNTHLVQQRNNERRYTVEGKENVGKDESPTSKSHDKARISLSEFENSIPQELQQFMSPTVSNNAEKNGPENESDYILPDFGNKYKYEKNLIKEDKEQRLKSGFKNFVGKVFYSTGANPKTKSQGSQTNRTNIRRSFSLRNSLSLNNLFKAKDTKNLSSTRNASSVKDSPSVSFTTNKASTKVASSPMNKSHHKNGSTKKSTWNSKTSSEKLTSNAENRKKSDYDDFSNEKIPKLPPIEQSNDSLQDILVNFEEKLDKINAEPPKNSNNINELFIKDDELTKDQIEDQKKKDVAHTQDDSEKDNDDSENSSTRSSNDGVLEENLKFLQDQIVWPIEIGDLEDRPTKEVSNLRKTREKEASNTIQKSDACELVILKKDDLQSLAEDRHSKNSLPTHLKYVGQFKDYPVVEVTMRRFDDILFEPPSGKNFKSLPPVVKKHSCNTSPKKVQFSQKISISETFSPDAYKRYNRSVTQYSLTESAEIGKIKDEINVYKCDEMPVHERSQANTHFFY